MIWIEAAAPAKPPAGDACNGCGVCCSLEPCPVGMLLSLRTRGACRALRWQADAGRYACGALSATTSTAWPLPWLHRWLRRRIAAGDGCDCTAEPADATQAG